MHGSGGAWSRGGAWSWGVHGPGGMYGSVGAWSQGIGIPPCTEADPLPPLGETATAADGTHPTGMHSCLARYFAESCMKMNEIGPGRRGEGGP